MSEREALSEKEMEDIFMEAMKAEMKHGLVGAATRASKVAAHAIYERLGERLFVAQGRRIVDLWYRRKGYNASAQTLMLGLMEEVGELAQAVLLTECDDFKPSGHKLRGELGEIERHEDVALETGDVLVYLLALCNRLNIEPKFRPLGGKVGCVYVMKEEEDGS